MKTRRILALAIVGLLCLPLISCAALFEQRYTVTAFDCFDTVTELSGYAASRKEFDDAWQDLHALLQRYHKLFDIYNTYDGLENLRSLNMTEPDERGYRTLVLDSEIIELLEYGKTMYKATDGKLNIAMGSVLSLWHSARESSVPPAKEELEAAGEHMDIEAIVIDREAGSVTITDPNLTVDVGAIGKGYAAKKAAERLKEQGREGYLLNLGGTVCPVGTKPFGLSWSVGVESPRGDGYIKEVKTDGLCVVMGGDSHRFFVSEGKRYGHIIDPLTLYPPEHFASVCVVTDDPLLGDVLTTVLFCLTEAEGRRLLESMEYVGEITVIWINEDLSTSEYSLSK